MKANNLPVGQFYHVSVEWQIPITSMAVCKTTAFGWAIRPIPAASPNSRWENLYGGDGFFAFTDPTDPDYIYVEAQGGAISRVNRRTLEARSYSAAAELWRGQTAFQLEHADALESD